MNIGIDKISFYSPNQYIDMRELAEWRNVDPDKFTYGLGQDQMAIAFPSQDAITLAANAAYKILDKEDRETIDLVLFATESGLDFSKASAVYVHKLLDIQPHVRSLELKEACYSGTGAIQLAKAHIAINPGKKVLILNSDISRYGLHSTGEPTQGSGAVAILMSENPKLMVLENEATYYTDHVMDFWRPNYSDVAFVDGKYSNDQYQRFFDLTYNSYLEKTNRTLKDFAALCFHIPYTKIGLKALRRVADEEKDAQLYSNFQHSITYNRRVGNVYTASLFLSLISLIDSKALKANDRIGFYSYGSGSVGEFFSVTMVEGYEAHLYPHHKEELDARIKIDQETYETHFEFELPTDGSLREVNFENDIGPFVLDKVENHIRYYKKK